MKKKIILSAAAMMFAAITLTLTACSAQKDSDGGNPEPVLPEISESTEADFSYPLSTDPTETVKAYYQAKEKQDYVLEFELRSVETDQTETDRICSLYRDSDLAHERGWENEIFDENRFTVVSADYYAKYDGTLVPYSGGEITENLWLIQDAENSEWQIVEIGH